MCRGPSFWRGPLPLDSTRPILTEGCPCCLAGDYDCRIEWRQICIAVIVHRHRHVIIACTYSVWPSYVYFLPSFIFRNHHQPKMAMAASSPRPRRSRRRCVACLVAVTISSLNRNAISRASAFSPKSFREHSNKVRRRSNTVALFAAANASDDSNDDGGPSPPLAALSSVSKRLKSSCSGACASYMNWLDQKPLTANAISAGIIAAMGDTLAQLIECRVGTATSTSTTCSIGGIVSRLNILRTVSFAASGIFFVGPYLHIFYVYLWSLGSHLQRRYNTSRRQQVFVQVLLDQTIGIILFYPLYYYVYEYCEAIFGLQALGPVVERATSKMMQNGNLMAVFLANWALWIPAQICTFWFVPERLRVFVSNIVSVLWNCFLCTKVA